MQDRERNATMRSVYEVVHYKIGPADDLLEAEEEDEKRLGLFTTRARADEAISLLRLKPGFRDWPGGFRVFETPLDEILAWDEGFREWHPGDDADEDGPA